MKYDLIQHEFPMARKDADFFGQFWPSALEYQSPLNAIFSAQLSEIGLMNLKPTWILRDGWLPLRYLYFSFPLLPKEIRAKFYVDESLIHEVPPGWQAQTGTYRMVNLKPQQKTDKIMLCGLIGAVLHPEKDLLARLKSISTKKPKEILAFVPHRSMAPDDGYAYAFRYYSLLSSYFNVPIRAVEWNEIQLKSDFQGYELVPLSNKRYVADCYMVQLILSKGATIGGVPRSARERVIPLSPYHGVALRDRLNSSSAKSKPHIEWLADWKTIGSQ